MYNRRFWILDLAMGQDIHVGVGCMHSALGLDDIFVYVCERSRTKLHESSACLDGERKYTRLYLFIAIVWFDFRYCYRR